LTHTASHEPPLFLQPEPRAALFLKEFDELLSSPSARGGGAVDGPRFVHVIRDGRDIAFGDLRLITSVMCAAFFEGYAEKFDPEQVSGAAQFAEQCTSLFPGSPSSVRSREFMLPMLTFVCSTLVLLPAACCFTFATTFALLPPVLAMRRPQPHMLRQAGQTRLGAACSKTGRNQLVAWALLNEAIADEAIARLGHHRYFAVRWDCSWDMAPGVSHAPTPLSSSSHPKKNSQLAFHSLASNRSVTFFCPMVARVQVRVEDVALDPNPSPTLTALLDFLTARGLPSDKVAAAVGGVAEHVTGR